MSNESIILKRLQICLKCPDSFKKKGGKILFCEYEDIPIKPVLKVSDCGLWPDESKFCPHCGKKIEVQE